MAVGLAFEGGSLDHKECGIGKGFTQCLNIKNEVTVGGAGWPHIQASKKNWVDVVSVVHSKEVKAVTPVLKCVRLMNLCPLSLVSPLSQIVLRIYSSTDGIKRIQTPDQYLNLMAWYVNAVEVIESEIATYRKIEEIKARTHGR